MNMRKLCVMAVMGASLIGGAAATYADDAGQAPAPRSQFQLDDGDSIALKADDTTTGYRICMDDGRFAVPLKVRYEGKTLVVAPGECRVIESKSIRLSSASRLGQGIALIGRFNGVTDDVGTRLAQVASDH